MHPGVSPIECPYCTDLGAYGTTHLFVHQQEETRPFLVCVGKHVTSIIEFKWQFIKQLLPSDPLAIAYARAWNLGIRETVLH